MVLLFVAGACEDPPSLIGSKMLPGSDFVEIESSLLKVKSYTMYRDSIPSSMPAVSFLGAVMDPFFGKTTCEFVSQVRLGAKWDASFIHIDSMKLFLQLLSVKGDTAGEHYLRMSEISDVIYDTAIYYSSQSVALTGFTVPDILLPRLREDTVNVIKIDVDTSLASRILDDTTKLKYTSTVDFRKYFKGIYFQLISFDHPILISLTCASPSAYGYYTNYFEIYGHDKSGVVKTFTLLLDAVSTNASFNLYRHNYTGYPAGEHVNDQNFLDTLSYAQQFNGIYTRLVLENLDSVKNALRSENISVNKARLKIPIKYADHSYRRATLPAKIYSSYLSSGELRYYVPEINTKYYNGVADTTAKSKLDDVYNINIASFVQGYLEDKTDKILPVLDLFLLSTAGNNVIFRANNNSIRPVKFEFTYTRF